MSQSFDVAIIGAGPAGSAAAITLARKGYSVAVLDKEHFPREKLCGDFLNPVNWSVYRELGVEADILAETHEKISAVRITAPSGAESFASIAQPREPGFFGLGISRTRLDSVLVRAAQRHGVVVLQRHRFRKLTRRTAGWQLEFENESDQESARARIVIGADGRNSRVAHHLKLGNGGSIGNAIGFQFRLRAPEQGRNRIEIHIFPGGYAGVVHLGDGSANLCLALTGNSLPRARPIDWTACTGLARNPFLRELMSRAEPRRELRSTFPVYFSPRRSYAERALLVGDAARVIEPVTGEGVYFAARSGLIAAETIDQAFQRGDFSAKNFNAYERRCRIAFRRRRLLNRLLQYIVYRPALGEALIRFSSKRQGLLTSIVRAICVPEQPEGLHREIV